jgi:hypothetical protein
MHRHTDFNTSGTNGPRLLSRVKAGTHSPSPTGSHTAAYTPKQGPSGRGRYHYPRSVPHVHKHPRAGCQNGVLCRFGILAGRCSRRTQKAFGTAMRLCVSLSRRRRGPAGLRDLFRFCRNRDLYIRRSWFSACARQGRYHHPRRALRAAETSGPRLLKRLTCRFLRSCSHQGISPCPLLSPIGTKQECNNLGASTAIVRSEQPIANAVGDAVLHGPHHRVIAIAAGRLIT